MSRLRIGYLCMDSAFSVRPLEALLARGHDVRFLLRPIGGLETRNKDVFKRHRGFDFVMRRALGVAAAEDPARDPFRVARAHDIPAYLVGNASCAGVVRLIDAERVDIIVVAFFNQLLKPSVFALPRLGTLNLHPSALPELRGPAPLFWTYRLGLLETALSIHRIAAGEDDGEVIAQQHVPVPLGTPGEDLVDDLAGRAAVLLPDVIDRVVDGTVQAQPQDAARATRAPRPAESDTLIDTSWTARRAFHFARGVGRWNFIVVVDGEQRLRVIDAIDFDDSQNMPATSARIGDVLHYRCIDGVVMLRVRDL